MEIVFISQKVSRTSDLAKIHKKSLSRRLSGLIVSPATPSDTCYRRQFILNRNRLTRRVNALSTLQPQGIPGAFLRRTLFKFNAYT
jgi:hypothetical protein